MAGLSVLRPGPLTCVRDLGRHGAAHQGVPRSGALDEPAHRAANRLVGNPPGAATLETTLGGVTVRALGTPLLVAVTGAPAPVRVDGHPVVLLADHPVTGGCPVLGVVPEADLAAAAQARPGTPVRFVPARR